MTPSLVNCVLGGNIIIVLGGTVFTEGGHYSLVNFVLGGIIH